MKQKALLTTLAGCVLALAGLVAIGIGLTGCASTEPLVAGAKVQASAADLRETLADVVKDAGRLSQMLVLADQAGADLETGAKELNRLQQEQTRLNAEFTATPDALRQIGERLQSLRTDYEVKAISIRQSLARLATDEEWKKITSRDLALIGN